MKAMFPILDVDTAPERSRAALQGAHQKFGFVPSPMGAMAASPTAVLGFGKMLAMFDSSSLTPLEREVLVMTFARLVECHYCMAMHSAILTTMKVDAALIRDLRIGAPLTDLRLEALRLFTVSAIERHGDADDASREGMISAGFTAEQALDVVVGLATYTLSTFANRLTRAPLDTAFAAHAWPDAAAR